MYTPGQKVLVVAYVEKAKDGTDQITVEIAGKKIKGTPVEGTAPRAAAAADTGDGGSETTPIVDFQETTPIVD